jgi:hypothetical protein
MDRRSLRFVHALVVSTLLMILMVVSPLALSGCGEGIVEKAMEDAAKQQGQDVNVDIDSKDGSVSVSSKDGDVSWQAGEGVELPEGFPAGLLPEGAKLMSAVTSTQDGSPSQLVVFQTSTNDKDMYDYYLEALPKAGFEVTEKLRMENDEQGNAIAIQAKSADSTIVISGGGKTDDKYSYTILVQNSQE